MAGLPPRLRINSTTALCPPAHARDNTECSPPVVLRLISAPVETKQGILIYLNILTVSKMTKSILI